MSVSETGSRINHAARRERHKNLRKNTPLFQRWRRIERDLSPREKYIESVFFWRITSLSTLFFFLLALLPQIFVNAEEFWATPEQSAELSFDSNGIAMVDEGFVIKQEIISAETDRAGFGVRQYTVQAGDTLSQIAAAHGVTVRTIQQNNDLLNPNSLKPGQTLKITPVNGLVHEVASGDTVEKIAAKYKVEAEKIIAQNTLNPDTALTAGEQLIIPGAQKELPKPVRTVATGGGGNSGRAAAPGISNFDPAPIPSGGLVHPANGKYTQYFHPGHWALDIGNRSGGPIYAAASGTVVISQGGWNGGYGNYIVIDHGNGMRTLYAHNKELYVSVGDWVEAGTVISSMGNTGRVYGATGIHLHFEIQVDGVKRNPLSYF